MSVRIQNALNKLLIKSKGEINSRLAEVSRDIKIDNTQATCHCYCIRVDANKNLRVNDLVDFIDEKIVEYAIPKKDIDAARKYFEETGSPSQIQRLRVRAEKLFVDLDKTGEGGEILLYILVQEFLKIPQLISKMSLKTSGKLHYQGADGIHVAYDSLSENLNLYWGEAKMFEDINDAIRECFKSLKSYLLDPISTGSVQERDLQLITSNIADNVNDQELENALVRYFDKDDPNSNKIVYKGLCFIGFDSTAYPKENILATTDEIVNSLKLEISKWHDNLQKKICGHQKLELKEMHVFLLPFPSVSAFRKLYLETIK